MLNHNYITELLKSKDIILHQVVESEKEVELHISQTQKPHKCPKCGSITSKIHDYRVQRVKDVPIMGKRTYLVLRKRRYVCKECGKKFFEHINFLGKRQRMTNRLAAYIISQLSSLSSMKEVARQTNVSVTTVMRLFDKVSPTKKIEDFSSEAICIDEFKGNAGGAKYQCIIVDPVKKQIVEILKDRRQDVLIEYFKRLKDRDKVKYFVCDMWRQFVETAKIYFKNAKIVIDKFHFTRYVYWALENVRKRVQKELEDNLRKYFKRSRKLLLKSYEELTAEQREELEVMFWYSRDLRKAHRLKEEFRKVLESSNSAQAKVELKKWIEAAERSGLSEFCRCIKVFRNWFSEIVNSFDVPYTNSVTEGFNNKIKVLKRNAFGYRNFERFRKRILYSCGS
ncbi:transposase IS204/IS1001/IS1096/IS1165 family protein [Caldicellulosiruptor kronotskyensis 2002]|uniref:Transposase IS204/IS1001/IS1096/IS1165 family protein n=1 Tax=Caldicellulosiruptor kronotskyensis (strain DSM 18902 / VKM B-2412 / 2002) TaxID=632348 RepID=E4SGU2_CALK2|nr:ISL3 family transposase [Caldicellulosiruptor kronotskyensis]ADQ46967.1 transposase IS204/IS1001/IS1096/IS1165 family protein [Caldicellulosiruptor kronotskyensis 2002]